MTAAPVYLPSQIKKRYRATQEEVTARRVTLYEIVSTMQPMTVRQVFYQSAVRNLVDKSENGYHKVQSDLALMRRAGEMPYQWITDNTRWMRQSPTFNGVEEVLTQVARLYRKSLWAVADDYVEIWAEKDALVGVLLPVTTLFDVPLMVTRGYASLSFVHTAAEYIASLDVPTTIYHLGDFDPSGVDAPNKIGETLHEMAPDADITFKRLGVTEKQIRQWRLPRRPTQNSDTRAKRFGPVSVELDAIKPDFLRRLVSDAVEQHLPPEELRILKIAEEDERRMLSLMVADVIQRKVAGEIS